MHTVPTNEIELEIPDQLQRLLVHYETNCVRDCCGVEAYEVVSNAVAARARTLPETDRAEMHLHVDGLITLTQDRSSTVRSSYLNHATVTDQARDELLHLLDNVRKGLSAARDHGPAIQRLTTAQMSDLERLTQFGSLTPPTNPATWSDVEQQLGAALPPDYRALVDAGGGGLWLDYIRVFTPTPPNRSYNHVDLTGSALWWQEMEEFRGDDVGLPKDLPEDVWLLRWADTGAGVQFHWRIDPGVPAENYPVLVSDRDGWHWTHYDTTTTSLLWNIVRGEINDHAINPAWLDPTKPYRDYGTGPAANR